MLQFTTEVAGQVVIDRLLSRLSERSSNFFPVFNEIAEDFIKIEENQFKSLGRGEWQPLSPRYAAWKARNYPGRPLMVRTGTLQTALTSRAARGRTETVTRNTLRVAIHLPYAIKHQLGDPTTNLPQRVLVDLREEDKRRWTRIIHNFLVSQGGIS